MILPAFPNIGGKAAGIACAVLGVALICVWSWGDHQAGRYKTEAAAHNATKQALIQRTAERDAWEAKANHADTEISALQALARGEQQRLQSALRAANERAALMAKAKPRPRTDTERNMVVDDETRLAAAARLNRGL